MKLVSLSQRIEDLGKEYLQFCPKEGLEYLDIIISYKDFLKQPLKLEMLVPCDDEGKPIEPPTEKDKIDLGGGFATIEERQELEDWENEYQKAQEKVLFKGFEYKNNTSSPSLIEHDSGLYIYDFELKDLSVINLLSDFEVEFELTENAIKKLNK